MYTKISIGLMGLVLFSFSAFIPAAQVRAVSLTPVYRCVLLDQNLSVGSNNQTNITDLQSFLYQGGYFNVQPVGSFGPLTYKAVQKFQNANNIPATGYVGPLTRNIIHRLSCNPPPRTGTPPALQSMSPTSANVGDTVVLYGSGFTSSNTIFFGNGVAAIVGSSNGSSLTFTVPSSLGPDCSTGGACPNWIQSLSSGTYGVVIKNTNGISNSLSLVVGGGINKISNSVSIQSLSPSAVADGGTLTVYGSGFTGSNTILIDNQTYSHISSSDGSTITVLLSSSGACSGISSIYGECPYYPQPGTHSLAVSNENGTSNSVSFSLLNVTPVNKIPSIQSLSTSSAPIYTTVTVSGSGLGSNILNNVFLNGMKIASAVSSDGSTLTFQIPAQMGYVASCFSDACPSSGSTPIPVSPGTYSLSVGNMYGTSNSLSFTVVASSISSQIPPVIQSLSPASGPIGTTISIVGSGFTSDNTIVSNNGTLASHVASPGGTTLSFTISNPPTTPCWDNGFGTVCPTPLLVSVFQGMNTISVQNSNGTSNSAVFTVTQACIRIGISCITPITSDTAPIIQTMTPTTANMGDIVTLTGSGFTSSNTVLFGNGTAGSAISNDGSTLTFTVPNAIGPDCSSGMMCPNWEMLVRDGAYPVAIKNSNGTSNAVTLTVNQSTVPIMWRLPRLINPPIGPTVLGASAYAFNANLHLGSKGKDVTALQQILAQEGYQVSVSGYFGTQTKAALQAYQLQHSIPQTGIVGPRTKAQLNQGLIQMNVGHAYKATTSTSTANK